MNEILIKLLTAALGSLGFALLCHVEGKKLLVASVGGALNCGFYLLLLGAYENYAIACFFTALIISAIAEVLARIWKTPVLTLLVPMLVSLIPGGNLYYSMLYLIQSNMESFRIYSQRLIYEAGAIAFGIILVACFMQTFLKILKHYKRKKRSASI